MWAMIPMLRTLSSATARVPTGAIVRLPAVVREGLVGLGHLVHVLAALRRRTDPVRGVEDLVGETVGHRLLTPCLGVGGEPADRERRGATWAHLHRDLVRGA